VAGVSTTRTLTILDEIVAVSRVALEATKRARPLAEVEALARRQRQCRDFVGALATDGKPRLIAEAKKASPSKGLLAPDYDAPALARRYEAAGAACLSVLTEPLYFQGALDHLSAARAATCLPCLRKDFLFDPYQVLEARAAGADAVLLIAAILPRSSLVALRELAEYLGMAALVEVHDEREVERALGAGARLVGINNRDLRTFQVSFETTARLRPLVPADRLVVSESGIHTREDVRRLRDLGVDAMLVGEALVKSGDVEATVHELLRGDEDGET
jgi:indole-3-glycerol phosphate synthase